MTTFIIVRHGQSQANAARILQGAKINTPLTALGVKQAQKTASKLSADEFEHVFASPLKRAAQTAAIIAPEQATTFDSRLREFDYGSWDGQPLTEIWEKYPQFFTATHNLLPGSQSISHGETHSQAKQRLAAFFAAVSQKFPTATVLVVSHGYTIKLMADLALGISDLAALSEPENAGVTIMEGTTHSLTLLAYGG